MGDACYLSFAPLTCPNVELDLPSRAHSHEKVLQSVSASAVRIDALLKRENGQGFVKRCKNFGFVRH
jgi:hypothetical protein